MGTVCCHSQGPSEKRTAFKKKYGLRRRKGCPDMPPRIIVASYNVPEDFAACCEATRGGVSQPPHQTHQKPHTATFPSLLGICPSEMELFSDEPQSAPSPPFWRVSPPHHDNIIYLTGGPGRRAVIRSLSCRKGESL